MKSLLLCAALALLIAGCNGNKSDNNNSDMNAKPMDHSMDMNSPTTAPTTQASAKAAPVNKYCAVEKDHAVDSTVTYLYQGKTIGFCCEDCIPQFQKDPEKYMKDLK
jgi:YHS domain-containing protein